LKRRAIIQTACSGQGHRHAHLARDQIQQLCDAPLPLRGQRKEPCAAQKHPFRPQSQHSHHIEPGTDTRVRQNGQSIADRFHDRG
jgi:hypothetical protein